MELTSGCFLQHLRLDEVCCLLSVRTAVALAEDFQLLDVHQKELPEQLHGLATPEICMAQGTTQSRRDAFSAHIKPCSTAGSYTATRGWHNEETIDVGKAQASDKGDLHSCAHLQFYCFLHSVTDLNKDQIMLLLDLLDQNTRERICFNEFYTVTCILLSHENHLEKQFTHRHLEATRFLFNIQKEELKNIFKDFDIAGDEQLNYKEFKMFVLY
ncbi:PREDICTED: EF-hand calcium-binding domain-containing protein 9 [Phaethon lepturus]|uniref:EF-hand calcium-binding domain-containing protein 9 n=1 Tax=Phaethon lepturus TaxID=97097 RepID=UPI0005304B6E|nr:PREDICTED: EF-hand calcium-binding domain-containing protein 9 [Phaethon lepturus]